MRFLTCSALQSGEIESVLLARGLEKVLESGADVQDMRHYALLALHSVEPELRRLAAKQIGILIQVQHLKFKDINEIEICQLQCLCQGCGENNSEKITKRKRKFFFC
jgi:hypothetical protein